MSIATSKDYPSIRPKATAHRRGAVATCLATGFIAASFSLLAAAQLPAVAPSMVDPNLVVTKVAFQLDQPTSMAFLGPNDILVTEKATGRVKRIVNNVVQPTLALDLAVNSNSERGLLHMALHPDFPGNPRVYLYWTQSSTGADSGVVGNVPTLGNRVDSYLWNGSTLTFDRAIIALRAFQLDAGQAGRGNHNGGVIGFGPDRKLYIVIGDNGRRGWLQNLPCGPTATCPGPTVTDDQFGGPAPDDAHLTGVLLRLNDDGTTPSDNPFFGPGASMGGEVGANIQKIFAYGIRNTFGFAFDPVAGSLWLEENGDDTFSQLSLVPPGLNSGWIQIRGPVSRIAEYKGIETSNVTDPCIGGNYNGLQQNRWPPANIANTPADALSRLFMLPGAVRKDPELSWKFEVAPAAVGFVASNALGVEYANDLIMGGARTFLEGGHLFRLKLNATRTNFALTDPRLADGVADNVCKFGITESESLLFGRNFGVVTDIKTGPDGNLYVLSLSNGLIYRISRRPPSVSFFVTSATSVTGDLGGLAGADATCQRLGTAINQGARTWRAYLSVERDSNGAPVNARDRIGSGPWYNANLQLIANDLSSLHSRAGDANLFVDERGQRINGQWIGSPTPNEHDILTGSNADGTVRPGFTCSDWTSAATDVTAQVGHSDGLGPNQNSTPPLNSWNSAHTALNCSNTAPRGGAGRFYCFAQ